MNAAKVIDFVDPTETLTWRRWILWIVVCTTNVNTFCRAHSSAQFATDALFHAVFIAIQHMATMQTFWLWNLFVHYLGALAHFAVLRLL